MFSDIQRREKEIVDDIRECIDLARTQWETSGGEILPAMTEDRFDRIDKLINIVFDNSK